MALAVLLLPSATALVGIPVPIPYIHIDLDVPSFVRPGPMVIPGWIGLKAVATNTGVPEKVVWFHDNGRVISDTSALDGSLSFDMGTLGRGRHDIYANSSGTWFVDCCYTMVVADPPGIPARLTAAPGPQWDEVTLAWSTPADDGGAALSRYAMQIGAWGAHLSPETRSLVREGLVPGQAYSVSLVAENPLGVSPARTLSFTLPPAPAHDAIEIELDGMRGCWQPVGCRDLAINETVVLGNGDDVKVRLHGTGRLLSQGNPVPNTALAIEGRVGFPDGGIGRSRILTDENGVFRWETYEAASSFMQNGECKPIRASAWAVYPGLTSNTVSQEARACWDY